MRYLTILFLLVLAAGCKKDDIKTFDGRDGISFYNDYYENADSINYSFALQPTVKTKDTVFIRMRLVGKPSNVARGIKLRTVTGSTARENVDYILPEVKLPANALFVNYPLVVFNTPEMLTKTFQLVLEVDPTSELVAGAAGVAVGLSGNFTQKKVNITNQLIEPAYWSNISYFFGAFSVKKFQFMIKATGLTNFDPAVLGLETIFLVQVKVNKAFADYVAQNGTTPY